MIEFHSGTEVTVTSDTYGPLKFQVAEWPVGMNTMEYLDYVMNQYWLLIGKNRRSYGEVHSI
jgi:hypothetical protein